jgi:hypothetical protein
MIPANARADDHGSRMLQRSLEGLLIKRSLQPNLNALGSQGAGLGLQAFVTTALENDHRIALRPQ